MAKRSIFQSKKGSYTLDIIVFVIFFFILAVGGILTKQIVTTLDDAAQNTAISNESKQLVEDIDDGYIGFWDTLFLVTFVILVLALWITSYLVDTHPFFFVIALVVVIIFTFISMLLSNVFDDLMSADAIIGTSSQFVIIPFLMGNIVPIMIFVSFVTAIILYAKLRQGGGQ